MENSTFFYNTNNNHDEVHRQLKFYVERKWTLKEKSSDYFELTRNSDTFRTHLIIAVLFGWWLAFIPNLIYFLLMKKRKRIFI